MDDPVFIGPMQLITLDELRQHKEHTGAARQRRDEAKSAFPPDEEIKQIVRQYYGDVLSQEDLETIISLQLQRKRLMVSTHVAFG